MPKWTTRYTLAQPGRLYVWETLYTLIRYPFEETHALTAGDQAGIVSATPALEVQLLK